MKNLMYVLTCLLILTSCNPWDIFDNGPGDDPVKQTVEIYGDWAWVQSTGGIAGNTIWQKDSPIILSLRFDKERFYIIRNGVTIQSGTYSLVFMKESDFGDSCYVMTTKTEYRDRDTYTNFSFTDDIAVRVDYEKEKLWIIYPCCDMYNSEFNRK